MIPGASSAATIAFVPSFPRNLSTSTTPRSQRLERIADEFLSLNKLKHYDYSILFRLRLGLNNSAPALSGLNLSVAAQHASTGAKAKAVEKTVSDVKLDKFDAAAKIKVIEEVRSFTELGLKMAKDLVEKAPIVVKKGVSKEEALRRINY